MINSQEKIAMRVILSAVVAGALAGCAGFQPASESKSYFLSIQDGRAGLVDGKSIVRDAADTLAVIEVTGNRLRVAQQIQMPTSLVGPPSSIAISPTKQLALISAATRRDTTDPKKVVSHDLVSVVELDPSGINIPKVIQTVTTGSGASGISFNREGTLALVANRVEGTVSLLSITGKQVAVIGKLKLQKNLDRLMQLSYLMAPKLWSAEMAIAASASSTSLDRQWRLTNVSCLQGYVRMDLMYRLMDLGLLSQIWAQVLATQTRSV